MLSLFCKLAFNNGGRHAVREISKIFLTPFHPLPCPFLWLDILVQVEAEAAQALRRALTESRKKKKLGPRLLEWPTLHPSLCWLVSQHSFGPLYAQAPRSAAFPLHWRLSLCLSWCRRQATLRWYQVLACRTMPCSINWNRRVVTPSKIWI